MPASSRQPAQSDTRSRGIIDVHSHALLPRWVDAVAAAQGMPRDKLMIAGTPIPSWSPEEHVAVMDAHGIAACVLSWPSATSFLRGSAAADLARRLNEDFAEIIARYPGRFGAYAVVPMDDMGAANEEMAYALDTLGLDGVACCTQADGAYLGDPRYDFWFEEMNRRGVALFVHPSEPPEGSKSKLTINPAIIEFMFESTRMLTNMVLSGAKRRFGEIKIISTHGGGAIPYLASRISILEPLFGAGEGRRALSAEEIFEGLASFYYDLTASTAAASLDAIRHLVPASRLMLGFDFPMMPAATIAPAIERFDAYRNISVSERQQIIGGTALDILPSVGARLSTPV